MGTPKQRKAAKLYVENERGKTTKPLGKVFKEAGYSDGTIVHPKLIVESVGFQEELEKLLPEAKLAAQHNELATKMNYAELKFPGDLKKPYVKKIAKRLGARNRLTKFIEVFDEDGNVDPKRCYWRVTCLLPDTKLQRDMLDISYKLRGLYAPEVKVNVNPFKQLSDAELDALLNGDELIRDEIEEGEVIG